MVGPKPTTKATRAGYENVEANCPLCKQECIFNRASDLCTFEPIAGSDVSCDICGRSFRLTGDTVNERHEILIYECHDLLKKKRYISCILNICQAYEMFFGLYMRAILLYEPFLSNSGNSSIALLTLNELFQNFENAIKSFGFDRMRGCFLRLCIETNRPSNVAEAGNFIRKLGSKLPKGLPKDCELKSVRDAALQGLLLRVKKSTVNELRNRVVHEMGYRPKREEAEGAWQEARSVLLPLTNRLKLRDDINLYLQRR